MSIRQLPEDVIDKIKSSVTVTSLNSVACGLLKNALDAGAGKINIYLDHGRGNCTVEDNGLGIVPDEFKPGGGLGKLHHTSRFPPSSRSHGKHGDFLAALGSLSLMTVMSHHHRHASHNSITIHNGKALARHLPCPPEQRFHIFDHGTRVVVRDLFGSMPVRVKHRAAVSSERPHLDREWGRLTCDITALLLAWSSSVTIVIRDTVAQRELRLKPPEAFDTVARTSRLFVQAGLADSSDSDSWIPVSASSGHIKISGCISLNPVATRRAQFLSLGIQSIPNDYGTNALHEEINKVFASSSFGVVEGTDSAESARRSTRQSATMRKGIERWPMFHLQIIQSAPSQRFDIDDILGGRQGDVAAVLDVLKAICYGFLKRHHMRPRKVAMSADESVFSTSTTLARSSQGLGRRPPSARSDRSRSRGGGRSESPARLNSPFDEWHRVKVGRPTSSAAAQKPALSRTQLDDLQSFTKRRLVGSGGKLLSKPFDDASPEPEADEARGTGPANENSADNFEARSNTPTDYVRPGQAAGLTTKEGSEESRVLSSKPTRLQRRPKPQQSPWLQEVLRSWNNPVFETAQPSVPRLRHDAPTPCLNGWRSHMPGHSDGSLAFESASANLDGRLSKATLSHAKVVSQVDRKFILIKLPLSTLNPGRSTSALVMLDQHAADERCRLEDLMKGYFENDPDAGGLQPVVEALDRPVVFEVLGREAQLLGQLRSHFGSWGIAYQVQSGDSTASRGTGTEQGPLKVRVGGLPPSISERCRSEPRLLVELMRREMWKLAEETAPSQVHEPEQGSDGAPTSKFHGCPGGILELLHSRSCRSAIMFNDVLSKDECEKLVRRLAECALPFQCAHGRPSMTPLVDLGSGTHIGEWGENDARCRVDAWKRWMGH